MKTHLVSRAAFQAVKGLSVYMLWVHSDVVENKMLNIPQDNVNSLSFRQLAGVLDIG